MSAHSLIVQVTTGLLTKLAMFGEWNDLDGKSSKLRGLKGAAWTSTPPYLQSSYRLITVPASISVNVGMRLAHTYP